jgi:hypothetical protein
VFAEWKFESKSASLAVVWIERQVATQIDGVALAQWQTEAEAL